MSDDQFEKTKEATYSLPPLSYGSFTINLNPIEEPIKKEIRDKLTIPEGTVIKLFGQEHGMSGDSNPEITVKSQFEALRCIMANKDSIIFAEGLPSDMTPSNPKYDRLRSTARRVFPNGVPERYDKLNVMQKKFLYEMLGSRVAYFLDIVDRVHSSNNEAVMGPLKNSLMRRGCSDEVVTQLRDIVYREQKGPLPPISVMKEALKDPFWNLGTLYEYYEIRHLEPCPEAIKDHLAEYKRFVFDVRENELKNMVALAVNAPENAGKPVLIIFGRTHNENIKKLFGDALEIIN